MTSPSLKPTTVPSSLTKQSKEPTPKPSLRPTSFPTSTLNPAKELSPQNNNNIHSSDGKFDDTYTNEEVEIDSNTLPMKEIMLLTKHVKCSRQFDNFI